MLDKIVLSRDRRSAVVHFDTHSFNFYSSDGNVLALVYEIVIQPSLELERRWEIAECDTIEIDLTEILRGDAA